MNGKTNQKQTENQKIYFLNYYTVATVTSRGYKWVCKKGSSKGLIVSNDLKTQIHMVTLEH